MKIKLNMLEQKMATFMGKARHDNAVRKHMNELKVGDHDAMMASIDGMGAEIAFCKAMNIYPDTEDDLDACELRPEDAILHNGLTVDVKQTHYTNGRLIVHPLKRHRAVDVYVLAVGKLPMYNLVGYMMAHDLLQDYRMHRLVVSGPRNYTASQDELDPIEDLRS